MKRAILAGLISCASMGCSRIDGGQGDPEDGSSAPPAAPVVVVEAEPGSAPSGLPPLVEPERFAEAPVIEGAWVAGPPFEVGQEHKVVVMETWATWCGPCREQFPHLTQLQNEHADHVKVVGVSAEGVKLVEDFVDDNRSVMGYTVVAEAGDTIQAYGRVGSNGGIPYSYIVRDGRVLWHGHPATMSNAFEAVLAGKWTPDVAEQVAALPKLLLSYLRYAKGGKTREASTLESVFRDEVVTDAGTQNNLAWEILTAVPAEHRDLEFALELARRCVEREQRSKWASLDTLALARWQTGDASGALRDQQEAVRRCHEEASPASCAELDRRLEQYRRGK